MLSKSIVILLALSLSTATYAAEPYIEMDEVNHNHAVHVQIEEDTAELAIEDLNERQVNHLMGFALCCSALFFVGMTLLDYIVPSALDHTAIS